MDKEELFIDMIHESLNPKIGVSHPIAITASDGNDYILKNDLVINEDGTSTHQDAEFFQESLGMQLAGYLNIPPRKYVLHRC